MAGHNKWTQIKRKKAVTDARRGANWTRIIREMTIAARNGGGEVSHNPRLRLAVDTAKAANMPGENIERAIKKGTGELEGVNYEEATYECYGPGGVAVLIDTVSDNSTRTVANIRHSLSRNHGTLGASGSVAWQFDRKGLIYVNASRYDEEATMMAALEAGAEDVALEGESYTITTDPTQFHIVQDELRKQSIEIESAEFSMIPKATVRVEGEDVARLLKMLEALEDLDDVQKVHSNLEIDEAALAEVGA